MSENVQQEIMDLQAQLAFQEDTIKSLNDEMSEQGKLILALSRKISSLESKLEEVAQDLSPNSSFSEQEVPPHY